MHPFKIYTGKRGRKYFQESGSGQSGESTADLHMNFCLSEDINLVKQVKQQAQRFI